MSWSGMNPNVWWQSQELFEASNLRIWSLFLVESTFPLLITASIITQSLFSLWVESGILSEVWVQHGQIGSWFQAEKESDLETVSSMAWFGFGEGVTGLVYVWTMLVTSNLKKNTDHMFSSRVASTYYRWIMAAPGWGFPLPSGLLGALGGSLRAQSPTHRLAAGNSQRKWNFEFLMVKSWMNAGFSVSM